MTQGEAKARASNVVSSQISIAYTLVYTLIDFEALHSFVTTSFIKRLDMVAEVLDDVRNISLPSGQNFTSLFCFKVLLVEIVRRELPIDLLVLENN